MMHRLIIIAMVGFMAFAAPSAARESVMLDLRLDRNQEIPFLQLNEAGRFTDGGLLLDSPGKVAKLDKFYALAERMVRYRIKPSSDAEIRFRSSVGDFNVVLSVPRRKVSILTSPATEVDVPFLEGNREYDIEIKHIYNKAVVIVRDAKGHRSAEVSAVNDGQGGCNEGALQPGFYVGMQWDHYCFGLEKGTSALVSRISVLSLKKKVRLMIYGDSITQPEGYYPSAIFHEAWTQRVISRLGGNAVSSGRGGGTINDLLVYIRNELPFVKCKYVMVTIGTNGCNTEKNLTELVDYIKSQGRIPILNNIPCNESGTQIDCNKLIASVREKTGVKGCMFDLVTSLAGDGKDVDKSLMFYEDLWEQHRWRVYHHPNGKGGEKMFERTLVDVPEIYR
jgi:hypothetical protein